MLAESFGLTYLEASKTEELENSITKAIEHKGAVLFNCVVKNTDVLPMIPAAAGHNEIVTSTNE